MAESILLLSSCYLPPISYFQAIQKTSTVWVDTEEHYIKQSFRSRAEIVHAHGLLSLSVPVIRSTGNHTPMKKIKICNKTPWQRHHWRSLEAAYQNSPFFLYYKDELAEFYKRSYGSLMEWNKDLFNFLLCKFKLSQQCQIAPEFIPYGSKEYDGLEVLDLRLLSPKNPSPFSAPSYMHTFAPCVPDSHLGNLSALDLLCNYGKLS